MTHHAQPPPMTPLEAASIRRMCDHRQQVAHAQASLQAFITILERVPFQERTYALSMDLYAKFKEFSGLDLPAGFVIEFGWQLNKACRGGRLPFRRTTHTRASLAAFDGISPDLLQAALQTARKPVA